MVHVNTLLGPVHPDEMGVTATHEYIMSGLPGWEYDNSFWFDMSRAFETCYNELMDFRLLGGQTYVDCSGVGLGRDLDIYAKLAQAIPQLHIIASTGFVEEEGIAPHFRRKDGGYFEDFFVREITQGMGQSGIKAGLICIGSSKATLTTTEKVICVAAARAAKNTGVAVIAQGAQTALEQLELLTKEGLNPEKIIISHLDSNGSVDLERDKRIACSGAYAAYDQIGIESWSTTPENMPDEERVKLILGMLEAGYENRIILSTSNKCHVLGWGETHLHNVAHLPRYFLPKLTAAGVSEASIDQILIDNPKRVLSIL